MRKFEVGDRIELRVPRVDGETLLEVNYSSGIVESVGPIPPGNPFYAKAVGKPAYGVRWDRGQLAGSTPRICYYLFDDVDRCKNFSKGIKDEP